ncbi:MAG: hypothetical protein COB38_02070 [Gammaproteobacteria bacterium]|nr:MAG: hypothetical protein COB38_02070 [Gammaproteobacteria bacterium]
MKFFENQQNRLTCKLHKTSRNICLQMKKVITNAIQANIDLKDEIKQRETVESELLRMATTDSLTQINNRRNFYTLANKEIERAVRYEKGCCLMM